MSRDNRNGRKRCYEDKPRPDRYAPKRRRTEHGEDKDGTTAPIGFKYLENICGTSIPETAILGLASKAERFEALLASEEIRPDLLKLVISALRLLCSTNNLVIKNAENLLRSSTTMKFMTGTVLSSFINDMPHSECWKDEDDRIRVVSDLTDIFRVLIPTYGESLVNKLPLAQLIVSLNDLKQMNLIQDADDLDKKIQQVKDLKNEVIRRARYAHDQESEVEPPQSFRELSVIPQAADLSSRPFLRKNITDRKFKDLDHYLDVQFRLLREDFVKPLRDGIKQLTKENNSLEPATSEKKVKRTNNVSVYHKVTVQYPVCSRKGLLYRIRFDSSHPEVKRVKWERSKRLKFGSLVCLSSDDFQSLVFATVEDRDSQGLSVGELDVRFQNVDKEEITVFVKEKEEFVMIESPAYFEAYRHVLEAMKEIKPEEFPFQKYIVECVHNIEIPEYQRVREDKPISFDLTGLCECSSATNSATSKASVVELDTNASSQRDESAVVAVNDSSSSLDVVMNDEVPQDIFNWPDRNSLGFNESQMRAFKLALTKEFAVIQGPPGTGKTYVGLKIAQAFLQNASIWQNGEGTSPILMVSYTNHALDQFLEGLLPMKGIVRVGSRSRSEMLNGYSLASFLRRRKFRASLPDVTTRNARRTATWKIQEKKRLYQRSSLLLKASRSGILSLEVFRSQGCIEERHYDQFCITARNRPISEELVKWLDIEREDTTQSLRAEDDHRRNDFRLEFATPGFIFEDDDVKQENGTWNGIVVLSMKDAKNQNYMRRNLTNKEVMADSAERQVRDVYHLSTRERWRLYKLWCQRLEINQKEQLETFQETYEEALSRRKEVTTMEEYSVLRNARVIGMTTTCAARYRRVLQRIRPKIILIEEAAEVLEAHTITSLTQGCQHLILIGDHQQLRPKPEVYELAKKYSLDVSLFERMVKVGIQCETLNVQHRMRPEIAALMKHIYDDLENHESVEKYEDIKGMKKNMFFISHSQLEKPCEDSHSHVNDHEAKFIVALCRYLIQQGYRSDQITLLTTYTGQMFAIRDCLQEDKSEELKQVRLKTVDNFQGQENDIILLSLVRSNKEENVGFLKIANRACVALSRAKKGFYCIGNFTLLSKESTIWSKIVGDLEKSGSIGNDLTLLCQTHREENTVETAEDFRKKAPDGGCVRPCMVRLNCGHSCKQLCHPRDTKHKNYKCEEPCGKTLRGCKHLCLNPCKEPCMTYCPELVDKVLPRCGHVVKITCSEYVNKVKCKERCDKTLPCGHRCQNRCSEPCTTKCNEFKKISRANWPCEHEVTIACWATPADCTAPCGATLECGHECPGKCGDCRLGRLHRGCKEECKRVLVCSHVCKEHCNFPCPPCPQSCENHCVHSRCDKKCGKLCVPCRYPCSWECPHHKCYKQCHEVCERPRCDEPCEKILPCYHVCRGLKCEKECSCAVCMRNDDRDKITVIFLGGEDDEDARFIRLPDCQHIFAVSDLDRYMDMSQDDTTESHVIQMKACPRCSTPIRTSLRYGAVIKQQLHDIEKVKVAQRKLSKTASRELKRKKSDLQRRLDDLEKRFSNERQKRSWGTLRTAVNKLLKPDKQRLVSITENELMVALIENKVTLMERFCSMSAKMKVNLGKVPMETCKENNLACDHVENELSYLERRFMSERVTQRELEDIDTEFSRLNLQLELCLLSHDVKTLALELDEPSRQMMNVVQKELSSGKRIAGGELDKLMNNIATIRRTNPGLNQLTPEEKREIVSAIGLSKGHWFKCPKGHIYAIGECGGAMQRSTCPECGAVIGGANHRLEEGNQLAPEMDGARYGAYSEQANLANYGNLQDIV